METNPRFGQWMTILIYLRLASGHVVAWGAQYQLTFATAPGDVALN